MSDTYSIFLYPGVRVEAKVGGQRTGFGTITLKLTDMKVGVDTGLAHVREIHLYFKPELTQALERAFNDIRFALTVQRLNLEAAALSTPAEAPEPPPPLSDPAGGC